MGREEWLLAENVNTEISLAHDALMMLDELERSGIYSSNDDPEEDRHEIASHVLGFHIERALLAGDCFLFGFTLFGGNGFLDLSVVFDLAGSFVELTIDFLISERG